MTTHWIHWTMVEINLWDRALNLWIDSQNRLHSKIVFESMNKFSTQRLPWKMMWLSLWITVLHILINSYTQPSVNNDVNESLKQSFESMIQFTTQTEVNNDVNTYLWWKWKYWTNKDTIKSSPSQTRMLLRKCTGQIKIILIYIHNVANEAKSLRIYCEYSIYLSSLNAEKFWLTMLIIFLHLAQIKLQPDEKMRSDICSLKSDFIRLSLYIMICVFREDKQKRNIMLS